MTTLFEQLGGAAAVDAAVDRFYAKVLADQRIKHFFDGIDMASQIGHQKRFLTYAFGGAPGYNGKSMAEAHARLVKQMGLNDEHFDAVLENLAGTLQELGVPANLIDQVALVGESVRDSVLNRA